MLTDTFNIGQVQLNVGNLALQIQQLQNTIAVHNEQIVEIMNKVVINGNGIVQIQTNVNQNGVNLGNQLNVVYQKLCNMIELWPVPFPTELSAPVTTDLPQEDQGSPF